MPDDSKHRQSTPPPFPGRPLSTPPPPPPQSVRPPATPPPLQQPQAGAPVSVPPPLGQSRSGQRRPTAQWMWLLGLAVAMVMIFIGIDEAAKFRQIEAGRTQFVYFLSSMFYYIGGIAGVYVGWIMMSLLAAAVCGIAGRRGLKRWNQK